MYTPKEDIHTHAHATDTTSMNMDMHTVNSGKFHFNIFQVSFIEVFDFHCMEKKLDILSIC